MRHGSIGGYEREKEDEAMWIDTVIRADSGD